MRDKYKTINGRRRYHCPMKKKTTAEIAMIFFFQANIPRTQYDGTLLVSDSEYLGTVDAIKGPKHQLAVKIAFITIPRWKSYVQLEDQPVVRLFSP